MTIFGNMLVNFAKPSIINHLVSSFRAISISSTLYQNNLKNSLVTQYSSDESSKQYNEKRIQLFKNINQQLISKTETRLFAVVQLCGKQFKITPGDVILVEGYWPPTIGDRIGLDKVLLAGSNDFTFIGCPILKPGVCDVQATIIEKTLTHTKTHFRKKRRKQYMRINFYRSPNTMIRINSIQINELNVSCLKPSEKDFTTRMFSK